VERQSSFGHSNARKLLALMGHLLGAGDKKAVAELKLATVGYRSGIYRHPRSGRRDPTRDGYEIRGIALPPAGLEQPATRIKREAYVDALQRALATGYLGIGSRALGRWFADNVARDIDKTPRPHDTLRDLHYNRLELLLLDGASGPLREALDRRPAAKGLIRRLGKHNPALKMIAHDWSRDTIWLTLTPARRAKARARVLRAQLRAIEDLAQGGRPETVVSDFVARSGLIGHVAQSLGMPDVARGPVTF
jgi:hypothetical protein